MKLSLAEARKLLLHSQGLRSPEPFGLGKDAVVRAIQQISYVQIDTISVVQRAHHHVIWSRVPDYQPEWLHELQTTDKKVLEYWSHAAAYLPIENFRFCLPRMLKYQQSDAHWWKKEPKVMKAVFDRIRKSGPLRARDFENTTGKKAGPWFDRTPSKKALEQLFHEGKLLISERRGFQKVYELADRHLPGQLNTTLPTQSEFTRHLITASLKANGLATAREISYLRKGELLTVERELKNMLAEDIISKVEVESLEGNFFKLRDVIVPTEPELRVAKILSPFDNLVIQRARLKSLFNFDYIIECYVPEKKRKFGYFVLPVLVGDQFVARIDAKADRATKTFIVKSIHYEKAFDKKRRLVADLINQEIERFAAFNGCKKIIFEKN